MLNAKTLKEKNKSGGLQQSPPPFRRRGLINQSMLLEHRENNMIWNIMLGKCSFQTCRLQNPEYSHMYSGCLSSCSPWEPVQCCTQFVLGQKKVPWKVSEFALLPAIQQARSLKIVNIYWCSIWIQAVVTHQLPFCLNVKLASIELTMNSVVDVNKKSF